MFYLPRENFGNFAVFWNLRRNIIGVKFFRIVAVLYNYLVKKFSSSVEVYSLKNLRINQSEARISV